MMSHELAGILLGLPNLPVVSGLERSGYGEPVESVDEADAHPYDDETGTYLKEQVAVIDLRFAESSSHSSTPDTTDEDA